MNFRSERLETFRKKQGLRQRSIARAGRRSWRYCLFAILLFFSFTLPAFADAANTTPEPETSPVNLEIRYLMPESNEVFLVWGIDGWNVLPQPERPPGTLVEDKAMHTPMARDGDTFFTNVQVPSGSLIDYGFLITKDLHNVPIKVWEGDGDQDYHTAVTQDEVVELSTKLTLAPVQINEDSDSRALVTQEIRYRMPAAGEVFFVWGIDGWLTLPEADRPAGTVVRDGVMHTPMTSDGGLFRVQVQAPLGTTIHYGFLITKKRGGVPIAAIWDGAVDYREIASQDGLIDVRSALTLADARALPTVAKVGVHMLAAVSIFLGIAALLWSIRTEPSRRTVALLLIVLMLLGLTIRLWVSWDTNHHFPDSPDRLGGDESGYDNLATELLRGSFFQWPGRMPIYPLFLTAVYFVFGHSYAIVLYAQAFIGITTIPLTFLLARRFLSVRGSLLAAALITLHPALILHTTRLYSEIVFTPLLILSLLALLWALEKPRLSRFLLGGGLIGLVTLTRPVTALMPIILPVLLPRTWSLRRRAFLGAAYIGAMLVVIAPWTYHNYRTYDTLLPLSISSYAYWQASPEYYHLMKEGKTALQIYTEYVEAASLNGHDATTIEGSRYFNNRALASIKAEPTIYAWYSLQKLAYFWIGHPANNWAWPFNYHWLFNYLPAWQISGIFLSRLLPILALMGLVILRRRISLFTPLLVVCGYFMLVHAILVPEARYSEPLHPILAIIIAAAILEGARLYQARRQHRVLETQNPQSSFSGRCRGFFQRHRVRYLWDLLRELVVRDMKLRYKRSILGIAWSLLNPLVELLVLVFLFKRAFRLDVPDYPSFAFTGVLAYSWFQSALSQAAGSITDNRELVRRPGFPVAILPVVTVTTNLIHFLLALPILLLFILLSGKPVTAAILALPMVIALEYLLILGVGYLVATFQVSFRDTQHLLGVALRLLFFLTPVFYSATMIPPRYQTLYRLNPIAQLITAYRTILLDGTLPNPLTLFILGVLAIGLVWFGYGVFVRASYRFVEEL